MLNIKMNEIVLFECEVNQFMAGHQSPNGRQGDGISRVYYILHMMILENTVAIVQTFSSLFSLQNCSLIHISQNIPEGPIDH